MPNDGRAIDKVDYVLNLRHSESTPQILLASNRQKKLLRFFDIPFNENTTIGAAGWEIDTIMANDENREKWRRYLFLTNDLDSDTDLLKPFDELVLQATQVPDDWESADAKQQFQNELVAKILTDKSPFDSPQPIVSFVGKTFMFTGKFTYGTRKACQEAVISKTGKAPNHKSVTRLIDFLVIGQEESSTWKHGDYGNKIQDAILCRREFGTPAIISEQHWVAALNG